MTDYTYTKHETLLTLDNVGLKYGDRWILKGVSTEVRNIDREGMEQGQVVCFLGPSGIGKTQLARLIAGLNTPTEGSIGIAHGTGMVPATAGLCGFVQQSYPLFGHMRVQAQLELAARLGGIKDVKGKIAEYTHQLGLLDNLDRYPRQFSGGQRQRLAIIRQLLCSEHFIILDEPFSGLDIVAKTKAVRLIQQVAQMHTINTIIVITHDISDGMSCADMVWLMGIEAKGEPAHIVDVLDLAADGLAWRPDIHTEPAFQERVAEVKQRFLEVAP